MSFEYYVAFGAGIAIGLIVMTLVYRRLPKRLNSKYYESRWQELQEKCADKDQWVQAIKDADDLLNKALKKRKVKGTNMGERMVAAQKRFTNNDAVWFGHKLRTKLDINSELTLSKDDVQKALTGLRQGLKDLGALQNA